jgi:endonuclease/exonuclease/phosphatase family metal-dependent hydrolase
VIDRVDLALRRLRRALSHSQWAARWLGVPEPAGRDAAGLLLVQIDGLARAVLEQAFESGHAPFLLALLAREDHLLHPLYAGVPSTTPVMQAELFYGVRGAVPAFSFVERGSGRGTYMAEPEGVRRVERRLAAQGAPLLAGGSAYCDVYTGGAADPRFCMASIGLGDLWRTQRPGAIPLLALGFAPALARASLRLAWEAVRALRGLGRGLRAQQDLRAELKFALARLAVGVGLSEAVVLGAKVDLARGLPVVHVNLLGYDEYAHRRGPSSASALRALRDVDRAVARLARAARRSVHRHYDVWVYSDHGQEPTVSYLESHGRSVGETVTEVLRAHGVEGSAPAAEALRGVQGQRARLFGFELLRLVAPGLAPPPAAQTRGGIAVSAQGPVGHVYPPRPLRGEEREALARAIVREAGVPLVLFAADDGHACAVNAQGRHRLPDDAARVVGAEHPLLAWVARDLAALCHHPDAGDLVLLGFRPEGGSLSFPHENGAHGGPGPRETDAFAVLPPDTPLPPPAPDAPRLAAAGASEPVAVLRPLDLRAAALTLLGRADAPTARRARPRRRALRIVTYNVHGCRGMDGHVSPERVARLLARLDPDVVALQELDVGRARSGGVDQAQAIAVALEMESHFLPTLSVEEERFGNAVLSRLPTRLVHAGPLPARAGRRREPRGALWVELDVGGRAIQLLNTHLSLYPRERSLQVETLLGPDWLGHPDCAPPRVLCGDLNALPFFPVCRRLGRVLRDVQGGRTRPWRTYAGLVPLGRIDHVFVERELSVERVAVPRSDLARVASDHLPLVVDVELAVGPGAEGRVAAAAAATAPTRS